MKRFLLQAVSDEDHLAPAREVFGLGDLQAATISTAFMTASGLSLLQSVLEPIADRTRLFVGIRNGVTTVQSIQKALEIGCETYMVDTGSRQRIFHPYYKLLRDDPGAILRFLLEYEVDQDLIASPWVTAAKAADKITSDPVVALMDEIARHGFCPDDLRGDGRISTATLAKEVWARGASRQDAPRRFANQVRDKFGGVTEANCINIERVEYRQTPDGVLTPYVLKRADRSGVQLPSLTEFRRLVSKVTGETYPVGGDWSEYRIADPETVNDIDPNGGDADAVLQYVKEKGVIVKNDDIPF